MNTNSNSFAILWQGISTACSVAWKIIYTYILFSVAVWCALILLAIVGLLVSIIAQNAFDFSILEAFTSLASAEAIVNFVVYGAGFTLPGLILHLFIAGALGPAEGSEYTQKMSEEIYGDLRGFVLKLRPR